MLTKHNNDEYYKQLHERVAKEYQTIPEIIRSIRCLNGYKYTYQQMIGRALRKKRKSTKKDYYTKLLFFLLNHEKDIHNIVVAK